MLGSASGKHETPFLGGVLRCCCCGYTELISALDKQTKSVRKGIDSERIASQNQHAQRPHEKHTAYSSTCDLPRCFIAAARCCCCRGGAAGCRVHFFVDGVVLLETILTAKIHGREAQLQALGTRQASFRGVVATGRGAQQDGHGDD
jgi:hypothetical protein